MANVYTDRCTDSEVWLTRDADKNAFGDVFREGVASSIPIVGELMAAFVPDTMTNNVVRSCPGVTIDRRSSFVADYILVGAAAVIILIFL